MSQQNFHEIIKYNSLCFVSEARPFNNNVLINGAQSYLQGTTGVENWIDFYLTSESKSYRIDGYGYDDDGDKLYFVFSEFHQGENVNTVDADEIRDGLVCLSSFIECIKDNSIFDDLDESEQSEIAILNDLKEKITSRKIELLYLTNCIAPPHYEKEEELKSIKHNHSVLGFSEMYRFHITADDIENSINVNLNEINNGAGLDILMATEASEQLEGYLLKMPGRILAEIYEIHKVGLLESNIRFYLQDKANTNKGILRTIRGDKKNLVEPEPEMFFSYNNGISATCTGIELDKDGKLAKITGLQIVNGGQTTASIHQILNTEHDEFLDRVSVQMKLSVIKNKAGKEEIIRRIAEYANTQNPIKQSDLTSNNSFIISIETFSKSTAPPSVVDGKVTSKWFFERKVGEYNNLQLIAKREARFDAFIMEFPKTQLIKKTDFAKRSWAWGVPNKNGKKEVLPYVANQSAEKVYRKYMDTIENNNIEADINFYKESIAKEILYKKIYAVVIELGVAGYKGNVALYTLSWLSYLSRDRIDLISIWDAQNISTKLQETFREMIPKVHEVILTPNQKKSEYFGKNIGEFTKKEECWALLKRKRFSLDDDIPEMTGTKIELIQKKGDDISNIEEMPQFWNSMTVWALNNDCMTDFEKSMMFSVATNLKIDKAFTLRQIKFKNNILDKALAEGFVYEGENK